MSNNRKQNIKKGFSLVEVLITLTILGVGLTSISFLMAKNIRNSQNARDQIVASSLSQEGIELMRNLKDNKGSILNTSPFDKCSSGTCTYVGIIDSQSTPTAANLQNGSGKVLNLSSGYFVHTAGTATKFYRAIQTQITGDGTATPSTRVITVVSEVWWGGSSMPSSCTVGNKCLSITSVMPDYQ